MGELKGSEADLLAIAGKLSVKAPGALSLLRSLLSKAQDSVSVLDYIPEEFHAGILARVVNNNIPEARVLAGWIDYAIEQAVKQRRRLLFPAGLYNIAPREGFAAEGGTCQRCFAIRSYMDLYGEAGASLRIVDGVSTDSAVVFMCMFGTNEQLSNVAWRGLEFDMNGQNNPISPNRNNSSLPHLGYSLLNQAHIFVSGTPSGNAALIDDVVLDSCILRNTPGVSSVVGAQSNIYGVRLGRRWQITNNKFLNGGLDTVDCSMIYGWFTDGVIQGNLFENDVQYGPTGMCVAFEVHGRNTKFVLNTVRRAYQAMWIDNNLSERVEDTLVCDNVFDLMKCFGVMFFGVNPVVEQTRRTKILRNSVVFDNSQHPGIDLKIGYGAATTPRGQSEIEIAGNSAQSGGSAVASATVVLSAPQTAGELHDQVAIEDNTSYFTTFGEVIKTNQTCGLGTISVRRNKRSNLTPAGVFGLSVGLSVSFDNNPSLVDHLIVSANQCVDNRAPSAKTDIGTRIEGLIGVLDYAPEVFRGMVQANYLETNLTVTKRSGTFERSYAYDPPSLADSSSVTTAVAMPGAVVGDIVRASFNVPLAGVDQSAWVSAANTVSVKFSNRTGGAVDLGSGSIVVRLERPLI